MYKGRHFQGGAVGKRSFTSKARRGVGRPQLSKLTVSLLVAFGALPVHALDPNALPEIGRAHV